MSQIHLRIDGDGVANLRMRDSSGRNALSERFVDELLERLVELGDNQRVKVGVLQGLDDVFCSGGSKEMLRDLASGRLPATDIMLTRALLEVPTPLIAAMEGHAVGGGLILGLSCDIILMARESRYGCPFMNMGFTPGMGSTRLLPHLLGDSLAAEMLYGGQSYRGTHFEGRPGINYVLARSDVDAKAMAVARAIAEKPRSSLELLKRELSLPKRRAFEEARTTESMMHELCFSRPETAALVEEFYAEGEGR